MYELEDLKQQINDLNKRVSKLENINRRRKIFKIISFVIGIIISIIIILVYLYIFKNIYSNILK